MIFDSIGVRGYAPKKTARGLRPGERMFMPLLGALDVYTGRLLWVHELPDVGTFLERKCREGKSRRIGAYAAYTGVQFSPRYVATPERVYHACGSTCLVIDAETGVTEETLSFGSAESCGILVADRTLIAAVAMRRPQRR